MLVLGNLSWMSFLLIWVNIPFMFYFCSRREKPPWHWVGLNQIPCVRKARTKPLGLPSPYEKISNSDDIKYEFWTKYRFTQWQQLQSRKAQIYYTKPFLLNLSFSSMKQVYRKIYVYFKYFAIFRNKCRQHYERRKTIFNNTLEHIKIYMSWNRTWILYKNNIHSPDSGDMP